MEQLDDIEDHVDENEVIVIERGHPSKFASLESIKRQPSNEVTRDDNNIKDDGNENPIFKSQKSSTHISLHDQIPEADVELGLHIDYTASPRIGKRNNDIRGEGIR